MRIRDVDVTVEGFDDMAADEIVRYIDYVQSKVPDPVTALDIRPAIDKSGKVELRYTQKTVKFERIRRITGYLVGTIDRWNNAKRMEEQEREKHDDSMG